MALASFLFEGFGVDFNLVRFFVSISQLVSLSLGVVDVLELFNAFLAKAEIL